MANKDNDCKNLEYKNIQVREEAIEALKLVFDMQAQLQKRLGFDFKNMSIGEKAKFLLINKHALEDEYSELLDALGGINDGIGSSAWKYWKKDNAEAFNMKLSDLSEDDMINLKFEFVDMFHFFLNIGLVINIKPRELIQLYLSKNKENHDRQNHGY